jgi:hypothetical protein
MIMATITNYFEQAQLSELKGSASNTLIEQPTKPAHALNELE